MRYKDTKGNYHQGTIYHYQYSNNNDEIIGIENELKLIKYGKYMINIMLVTPNRKLYVDIGNKYYIQNSDDIQNIEIECSINKHIKNFGIYFDQKNEIITNNDHFVIFLIKFTLTQQYFDNEHNDKYNEKPQRDLINKHNDNYHNNPNDNGDEPHNIYSDLSKFRIVKSYDSITDLSNVDNSVNIGDHVILKSAIGNDHLYVKNNKNKMEYVCRIGDGLPRFFGEYLKCFPGKRIPMYENHDVAEKDLNEKGIDNFYKDNQLWESHRDNIDNDKKICLYLDDKGYVRWLLHNDMS